MRVTCRDDVFGDAQRPRAARMKALSGLSIRLATDPATFTS